MKIKGWRSGLGFWLLLCSSFLITMVICNWKILYNHVLGRNRGIYDTHTFTAKFLTWLSRNPETQIFIVCIPFVFIVLWIALYEIGIITSTPVTTFGVVLLSVGGSSCGLVGVLWFHDHRKEWTNKLLDVQVAMTRYDETIHEIIMTRSQGFSLEQEEELRDTVSKAIYRILECLCTVVAHRFHPRTKGASFLVLKELTNDEVAYDGDFRVFAKIRNDSPDVFRKINTNLFREDSFAGLVLSGEGVVEMYDCRCPPNGLRWKNLQSDERPRFMGRAAAPVKHYSSNKTMEIGVLCFDILVPWVLADDERELLSVAAERIAALWRLYPRPSNKPGSLHPEIWIG